MGGPSNNSVESCVDACGAPGNNIAGVEASTCCMCLHFVSLFDGLSSPDQISLLKGVAISAISKVSGWLSSERHLYQNATCLARGIAMSPVVQLTGSSFTVTSVWAHTSDGKVERAMEVCDADTMIYLSI
jgi:hypothetical protein